MAQAVFSPRETPDWFSDKARQAQSSILVAAPYIGRVLEELVSDCNPRVSIEIFTSLRISDVLSGATDVDAVYRLSKRARVRSIGN
ncbi:MAG: hypothetical protein NZN28_12860, partial [Meiothermus sp.]|uniref:hypothetical protein n=1 Tax=Meiothermus sp. TaxID=1955249 RepID=UPI0025EA9158